MKVDMLGKKFGKLTVMKRGPNDMYGQIRWYCQCDCGNTCLVNGYKLRVGHTTSCGCVRKGINSTHKMTNTRIYREWCHMKQRCLDPKIVEWKRYGGRGITVCNEWKNDFQSFYNWAISNGYSDKLTLDRIDNDGNYEPSNCRWTTMKEQVENRSNTLKFEGKTLKEWSEKLDIKYSTLWMRIFVYKWPLEKALERS